MWRREPAHAGPRPASRPYALHCALLLKRAFTAGTL